MEEHPGLGAYLRECREARGFSVDDLSAATRIVPRLIRALEGDRFGDLPAAVYVRGFIRAYCAQVEAPPESALARYEAHREAESRARAAGPGSSAFPRPFGTRPRPLTGAAVACLLVALGGSLYLRTPSGGTLTAGVPPGGAAAPASASSRDDAQAKPPPTPEDRVPAPAAEATKPAEGRSRLLVLRAHDDTWIRIKPEEGPATQEVLPAGAVREWRSARGFLVTLGNAGGVSVELDGVTLPPLGVSGEVVRDVPIPRRPSP